MKITCASQRRSSDRAGMLAALSPGHASDASVCRARYRRLSGDQAGSDGRRDHCKFDPHVTSPRSR